MAFLLVYAWVVILLHSVSFLNIRRFLFLITTPPTHNQLLHKNKMFSNSKVLEKTKDNDLDFFSIFSFLFEKLACNSALPKEKFRKQKCFDWVQFFLDCFFFCSYEFKIDEESRTLHSLSQNKPFQAEIKMNLFLNAIITIECCKSKT